jgi:hypothetical protein
VDDSSFPAQVIGPKQPNGFASERRQTAQQKAGARGARRFEGIENQMGHSAGAHLRVFHFPERGGVPPQIGGENGDQVLFHVFPGFYEIA